MFTTIWHSGESKTIKIVKRWVFSRGQDFPYSSVDKESTCNAGDPSSIPGSGRSTEEGIGYPLHYSWASLVAQLVKNPPAMQETWVQSLSLEEPLKKGKATYSSILVWRIPWTLQSMGLQRVRHDWSSFTSLQNCKQVMMSTSNSKYLTSKLWRRKS